MKLGLINVSIKLTGRCLVDVREPVIAVKLNADFLYFMAIGLRIKSFAFYLATITIFYNAFRSILNITIF